MSVSNRLMRTCMLCAKEMWAEHEPLVPMVMPMVPLALPMVPLVSQWYHWLPLVPLGKLPMVPLGNPEPSHCLQYWQPTVFTNGITNGDIGRTLNDTGIPLVPLVEP